MWVANMDRLPTRARLASWGLQIPTACCLFSALVETRDHLFITRNYIRSLAYPSARSLSPL
uniref:Reverse transcriptase zinc-binding domain-containing protein n=1 Tax=Brassica oleracea TaxID=3712 RepID=A0A3P6G383_BRAOL|nr:unnamed protein product [Brassica oleracea]